MNDNIRPCERCNAPTTFEKNNDSEPHEGQVCDICERWICNNCEDTRLLPEFERFDNICIDCSKDLTNSRDSGIIRDRRL
jgi:hypothetical protein